MPVGIDVEPHVPSYPYTREISPVREAIHRNGKASLDEGIYQRRPFIESLPGRRSYI